VLFAGFAGGRLGATAPDQIAAGLELDPDALALDVACGPGNTTRPLLAHIGEAGRVVGLDAAPAMLARAVRDTDDPRASYVLGDAGALPFASATFDAVTCLGGLYLMDEPHRVLAELVRVLAPGGRLAILTSAVRGPVPARPLLARMNLLTGVRLFDQDEVADRLRLLGMQRVRRHLQGFFQLVTATAPEAGRG